MLSFYDMRNDIVHPGADELTYEIRQIVDVAKKLEKTGIDIYWENIGDPVAKGERIEEWMKEKIIDLINKENDIFAYSPTMGDLKAREYIAYERNIEGGIQITTDDILFFNGLGDAISKVYAYLKKEARVLIPDPTYPTHSSAEKAHSNKKGFTYRLDSKNSWYPDLADMREKVEKNPEISGITIINPDNPTGMVYPKSVMREIVRLAREYQLFIISDEIYSNIFYGGADHKKIASVIDDVPAIAMRGISKEFPWPGARCGWVEFYNRDKDNVFDRYCQSLIDAKMLEVCSTTLPQKMIPIIMSDERYYPYLKKKNKRYEKRSKELYETLKDVDGLIVNEARGAFYSAVVFEKGLLKGDEGVEIENSEARTIVSPFLKKEGPPDKRFVYNLLASTGICVVPLSSGFNSTEQGFRITLLECDDKKFSYILQKLKTFIEKYIS